MVVTVPSALECQCIRERAKAFVGDAPAARPLPNGGGRPRAPGPSRGPPAAPAPAAAAPPQPVGPEGVGPKELGHARQTQDDV